MGRIILFGIIGAVIIGLWARSAFIEKQRAQKLAAQTKQPRDEPSDEPSELNKHPERLEENLDPTDDA